MQTKDIINFVFLFFRILKYTIIFVPMKPDDKPKKKEETFEDPKLFIVVDDKVVPKPGLETAFVAVADDYYFNSSEEYIVKIVKEVCSCNKVIVSIGGSAVESNKCPGYQACTCVGYVAPAKNTQNVNNSRSSGSSGKSSGSSGRSSGSRGGTGCSCAPVH